MRFNQYGIEPLRQAWAFYSRGYDQHRDVHENTTLQLLGEIRIAKATRDDARASSQKYLDEKRQADARTALFSNEINAIDDLREAFNNLDGFDPEPLEPMGRMTARKLGDLMICIKAVVKQ